jgi:hypothetical protein
MNTDMPNDNQTATPSPSCDAACSASFACPHCGYTGATKPYGMNPEIHECIKCKGTWWNEYKPGSPILPNDPAMARRAGDRNQIDG